MKWVALLIFILMVPAIKAWIQSNPSKAHYVWALLGFLPLVSSAWHIVIAPISWATWPGYARGMEVSPIEALALAIILSRRKTKGLFPFTWLWVAYIAALLVSVCFSGVPMGSMFVAWQEMRMLLVFTAAATVATDERGPKALIAGMGIAMAINAGFALQQRLTGTLQAYGLFTHQNIGGMAAHFVALPAMGIVLAEKNFRMGVVAIAAAAIIVVLGASRGSIGFAALGFALVLGFSLIRKPTKRKWSIVGASALALAIAAPIAVSSLDKRFAASAGEDSSYDERAAFEKAAKLMWADHPMGVGANQYVNVANMGGYSERGGVIWNWGSRAANVHNSYLLTAAESGYLGLITFIALLITPAIVGLKNAFGRGQERLRDLLIGPSVALIIVAIHCLYEWVFVTAFIQWLFAINMGIIAGTLYRIRQPVRRPVIKAALDTSDKPGPQTLQPA